MFLVLLHNLIRPGQQDCGSEEGHVDEDLPFQMFRILVGNIDKSLQEMNAGDADQGCRQFDLDGARIDVRQPIRTIGMVL